ncbi:DUF4334 domain-containing protein [Xaviernesmea oryzae]|uniref:DUF4334 domain-containing protein n=1 Tax=Rhizobium/Agrobacterium group TaxID=227290 RepID=UPI00135662A3
MAESYSRIARNWFTYLQKAPRAAGAGGPVATLNTSSFRGKMSAEMIYDRQPVIDLPPG